MGVCGCVGVCVCAGWSGWCGGWWVPYMADMCVCVCRLSWLVWRVVGRLYGWHVCGCVCRLIWLVGRVVALVGPLYGWHVCVCMQADLAGVEGGGSPMWLPMPPCMCEDNPALKRKADNKYCGCFVPRYSGIIQYFKGIVSKELHRSASASLNQITVLWCYFLWGMAFNPAFSLFSSIFFLKCKINKIQSIC